MTSMIENSMRVNVCILVTLREQNELSKMKNEIIIYRNIHELSDLKLGSNLTNFNLSLTCFSSVSTASSILRIPTRVDLFGHLQAITIPL